MYCPQGGWPPTAHVTLVLGWVPIDKGNGFRSSRVGAGATELDEQLTVSVFDHLKDNGKSGR